MNGWGANRTARWTTNRAVLGSNHKNHLDNLTTLRRLIEFYVVEHNQTIPHNAFDGQTPDEMYIGHGTTVPDELAERRRAARRRRLEVNRDATCSSCSQAGAALREVVAA